MKTKIVLFSLILLGCTILSSTKVFAEQTIINIPSSDILPAKSIIIKESNRFYSTFENGTSTITPSVTFGVGHGIEFSAGSGTTIDDKSIIKGHFAAKKVFFLRGSTRLTVGGSISPYFTSGASPDSFLYSHISQKIPKTRTTLTAGAFIRGQKSMPNVGGMVLGIEQVIVPNKLRLAVDWISRNDSYGKMGIGLKYRPIPSLSLTTAVIIPNRDEDRVGFNLSLSKYIDLSDLQLKRKESEPCQEQKNL